MRGAKSAPALRDVRLLFTIGTVAGLSDEELIARFVADRDAIAFEAIVAKHGPMVLAVCRSHLGDTPSVDDAFQATFLVLVRKAAAIRVDGTLGRWLHGVSRRVAARAAKLQACQRGREVAIGIDPAADLSPDPIELREFSDLLREEVASLPATYRAPILAHYFEGLSHEQAAERLRWPLGTVKGRLARARELLRERLSRRGITATMALVAASLAPRSARAGVRESLRAATVDAAVGFASGASAVGTVPIAAILMAEGVLSTMARTKVAAMLTVLLVSTLAGGGIVYSASSAHPGAPSGAGAARTGDPVRDVEIALLREKIRGVEIGIAKAKDALAALGDVKKAKAKADLQRLKIDLFTEAIGEYAARIAALETGAEPVWSAPSERGPGLRRYPSGQETIGSLLAMKASSLDEVANAEEEVREAEALRQRAQWALDRAAERLKFAQDSLKSVELSLPKARGQVNRAAAQRSPGYSVVYPVGDLIAESPESGANPDELYRPLIDLISQSVLPKSWKWAGEPISEADEAQGQIGRISRAPEGKALQVRHHAKAHGQVAERLRQLRLLRGFKEPARDPVPPKPAHPNHERPTPAAEASDIKIDYIVSPGDSIVIRHGPGGEQGTIGIYEVDADGFVTLGKIGRVRVADLGLGEARTEIVAQLLVSFEADPLGFFYLDNGRLKYVTPVETKKVRVSVIPGGKFAHIQGDIRKPGRVSLEGKVTALGAILGAGGTAKPLDEADVRVFRVEPSGRIESIHNLDYAALTAEEKTKNLELRAGDVVWVRSLK